MTRVLDRRGFLKAFGSGALVALGAACTSAAPSPTAAPAKPAVTSAPPASGAPAAPPKEPAPPAAPAASPVAPASGGPAAAPKAAAPAAAGKTTRIKIVVGGPVLNPALANYWISEPLGYYREEGVEADWGPSQGAQQAMAWLLTGQVQGAMLTADPMLNQAAQGEKVPIVGVYLSNRKLGYGIAVLPNSPIKTVKDLKGKKVGIPTLGSGQYLMVRALLKEAGYDPDADVSYINVGQDAPAGHALQQGQVDAITQTTVSFANLRNAGVEVRELPETPLQEALFGNMVAVKKEFLDANRQALIGFCRAMARATVFYLENPGMALRLHWKLFPESIPKGMGDQEAFEKTLKTFDARIPAFSKKPAEKWGEFHPEDWQTYLKFLGHEGKVDPKPFYTNDLIEEINRFDEAKIKEQAKSYKL